MGAIERIEVVKGPQSAVQGTKAMSGVINVVTKKGDKDNPYAELNALYGTGGEIRGGAALGGGIGDFNYFLAGSAKTQQEYETSEGTNPYSTQDLSNLYANLGYDINDSHSISLELRHDDIYDINYNRFLTYPGYSQTWTDLTQEEFEYSGIFLQYNGEIFENFSIFADLGYATFDSKDYNAQPIDSWLAGDPHKKAKMDEVHTFAELRANYEVMPDQLKLIAGVQYKKSDMEWWKSEPSWSDPDVMDEMTIDKEQSYIAPFAQIEYRPIDYFLVQGGIRHDSYSYSDDTPDKSKTTKKLGVSIFPFVNTYHDWTTLFAVYNEGFRAPLGNELFYPVVGNPDLKPEEAKGWEVGLKQRLSTWADIQLSYFSTDYTDQIKVVYPSTPGPPKFQNIADNTIKGWEAGVQAYPLDLSAVICFLHGHGAG
jgi:outer membrane cobalamin receptor